MSRGKCGRGRDFLRFSVYLLAVFLVSVAMVRFMAQKTDVVGNSMNPTLRDGDSVLVDKVGCRMRDPRRFEIIVFQDSRQENCYYIKRVIGLPGETVTIENGCVCIDGRPLSGPESLVHVTRAGRAGDPVALGDDEYFVMGDNRSCSSDSRDYDIGNISGAMIFGRAVAVIWPFDRIRGL